MTPEQQKAIALANARKRKAAQSQPFYADKVGRGRTAFDQTLQGATFGFADEATDRIGAFIASMATGQDYDQLLQTARGATKELQGKQFDQHPVTSIVANVAGGLLTGGAGASTKAGSSLINSARNSNAGARIAQGIGLGALSGGAYGAGTAEDGNRAEGAVRGAILGGITGGAIPAAGAAYSGVRGALNPTIEGTKKGVVELAKKYNVPIYLDDVAESSAYKTLISAGEKLPGSGANKSFEAQQKAFNRAVAKTFGQDADSITPEVIKAAYDDLGGQFEKFFKGKKFEVTPAFADKIDDMANRALNGDYGEAGPKFIQRYLQKTDDLIQDGVIKGDKLDKFRRDLAKTSRTNKGDIGRLASDFEDGIVDILTQGDSALKKQMSKTKMQYKNLKAIQREALKDQVDGNIRPAMLTSAVRSKYGEDALAKGTAGELGDLARVGQLIKQTIPDSGTAQRNFYTGLLSGNLTAALPIGVYGGLPGLAMQGAATGAGLGANRLLQNRNVNQAILDKALKRTNSSVFLPKARTLGLLSGITPNAAIQ